MQENKTHIWWKWKGRMNILLKNSKQRGQFMLKQNSHSHVVTAHLVKVALQSERNVPQWLLTIFCSQIVHVLLTSLTAPLTSWSQTIPLQEMTLILFHKLPNSFHRNPLPLQALDAAKTKLCSELVCKTSLCGEQLLPASSPAQTPTASSVKPGHVSQLWCYTSNNWIFHSHHDNVTYIWKKHQNPRVTKISLSLAKCI